MNGLLLNTDFGQSVDKVKKTIYVLMIDSGSTMAKAIKHVTKEPYNHVSLSFDRSLESMYSFNTSGFIIENLKKTYKPEAKFSLYAINVDSKTIKTMQTVIDKIFSEKDNYKYNWSGLGGVLLNKEVKRDNQFFCSEYVAYVFKNVGLDIFDKPVSLVKPYDFAKNKHFKFVYRGTVRSFSPEKVKPI